MSIRRDFPDLPPVWAAGTLGLQCIAAWLLPIRGFAADRIGWFLVAVGLGLVGWAALKFRRHRTTIEPRETPAHLIVEGPFRINRNPIYTGMALMLVGFGAVLGTVSALLCAAIFPVIVTQRFIRGEEGDLRAAFGADADRYLDATRRW